MNEPALRVGNLHDGNYVGFFYGDGVRFAIERGGREIWAEWPDGYLLEDVCTYLFGPVIAFALRVAGKTCLHASSVVIRDRAIVFVGAAGSGKSTAAAVFAKLGYPVLSDDITVLADQGENFLVQPGYPRVNLWPDSVRALFGSENALPHITPTWGKRYVPLDQNGFQFQSEPLPIGAVYILGERDERLASPIVEELGGSNGLASLVANTYLNYLLDTKMQKRDFEVISRMMTQVPVRLVRQTSDPSKVFELCKAIVSDYRGSEESLSIPGPAGAD